MRPLLFAVFVPLVASAAPFRPLPPVTGEAPSGLLGRVVRYDGSTNGQMVIQVQNPTKGALTFNPDGLFFVPSVNADHAPQRLGAVGGFDVQLNGVSKRDERLTVAPGATAELRMDVYCIDSHRSSPTSETPFRIAGNRMPRQLHQEIKTATEQAAKELGGYAAPASKSAVQSEVWRNRDKRWIKLDGEGKQEANK